MTGNSPAIEWVGRVDIGVSAAPWPFAQANRDAIAAHWRQRSAENPAMFNGRVLILADWNIDGTGFHGTAIGVDFADYLYWRETGRRDTTVRHVFGAAAIQPADGGIVTGLAGAGTINVGRLHFPGGFIDSDDVAEAPGGGPVVDLVGQIYREIAEEIGLSRQTVSGPNGYLVVQVDNEIGLVGLFETALRGAEVAAALEAHNRGAGANHHGADGPEIQALKLLTSPAQLEGHTVAAYAEAVVRYLLGRA